MTALVSRLSLALSVVAVIGVTACSQDGSPTAPSVASAGGATIAGLVDGGGSSAASAPSALTAAAPPSLSVSIEGTDLASAVDGSGHFSVSGVPPGDARLRFSGGAVNATAVVPDVEDGEQIEIEVVLSGDTAVIVNEVRLVEKVQLCHRSNDKYHLIEVSASAEAAHRAHGDGAIGEGVDGGLSSVFLSDCQVVGVAIEKSTNGEDADEVPGPSILEGELVTWEYVVTNTGDTVLDPVAVTDNVLGAVTCPQTSLAVDESMTCEAFGVAALEQYSNVGTVEASTGEISVEDEDASHYFGVAVLEEVVEDDVAEGKIRLCHQTGNGRYHSIVVSLSAEPAHRAHGDGQIGDVVPDSDPPMVFLEGCEIGAASPPP